MVDLTELNFIRKACIFRQRLPSISFEASLDILALFVSMRWLLCTVFLIYRFISPRKLVLLVSTQLVAVLTFTDFYLQLFVLQIELLKQLLH